MLALPLATIPTIAITGTPGAGKSTAACALAHRLSQLVQPGQAVRYLETGFWYRVAGWLHATGQLVWDGSLDLAKLKSFDFKTFLQVPANQVLIQHPDIDLPTAWLAQNPEVRGIIAARQQEVIARPTSKVLVGAGLPGELNIYLHTDATTGASRRCQLQRQWGRHVNIAELERVVALRTEQDAGRANAAVKTVDGGLSIDTTNLTAFEVDALIWAEVERSINTGRVVLATQALVH